MALFLFLVACGICLCSGRWLDETDEFLIYTETEPPATEEKVESPEDGSGSGDIDKEAEDALNKIYKEGNKA